MAKPTLYKKVSIQSVQSRSRGAFTEDEKTRTDSVVSKFFELFKATHLS